MWKNNLRPTPLSVLSTKSRRIPLQALSRQIPIKVSLRNHHAATSALTCEKRRRNGVIFSKRCIVLHSNVERTVGWTIERAIEAYFTWRRGPGRKMPFSSD